MTRFRRDNAANPAPFSEGQEAVITLEAEVPAENPAKAAWEIRLEELLPKGPVNDSPIFRNAEGDREQEIDGKYVVVEAGDETRAKLEEQAKRETGFYPDAEIILPVTTETPQEPLEVTAEEKPALEEVGPVGEPAAIPEPVAEAAPTTASEPTAGEVQGGGKPTRYFKAIFDNCIEARSTQSRAYTHAAVIIFKLDNGKDESRASWSSAEKSARTNLGQLLNEYKSRSPQGDVVPAVEIDAKEYREIKGGKNRVEVPEEVTPETRDTFTDDMPAAEIQAKLDAPEPKRQTKEEKLGDVFGAVTDHIMDVLIKAEAALRNSQPTIPMPSSERRHAEALKALQAVLAGEHG